MSQETLAEMVGTTRSRVNFFLNKFKKLGFIEYHGELIEALDRRVPHLEREGEIRIAREAAALKQKALTRATRTARTRGATRE